MQKPAGNASVVHHAARVLESFATRLRERAERVPEQPDLWLSVRDVEGLAGRLLDSDGSEWTDGFGSLFFTGQDLGVLDEILGHVDVRLPELTLAERESLNDLRQVLQRVI